MGKSLHNHTSGIWYVTRFLLEHLLRTHTKEWLIRRIIKRLVFHVNEMSPHINSLTWQFAFMFLSLSAIAFTSINLWVTHIWFFEWVGLSPVPGNRGLFFFEICCASCSCCSYTQNMDLSLDNVFLIYVFTVFIWKKKNIPVFLLSHDQVWDNQIPYLPARAFAGC